MARVRRRLAGGGPATAAALTVDWRGRPAKSGECPGHRELRAEVNGSKMGEREASAGMACGAPPGNSPSELTVLQVGEGRFLRAFLGVLAAQARDRGEFRGRLILTAPRANGSERLAALRAAGGRYRLVVRGEQGEQTRFIAPYDRIIDSVSESEDLLGEITLPSPLIIVSNTTEAGLDYRPDDPKRPVTYPARLAVWLQARRDAGAAGPVCVIPCELVAENARVLQEAAVRHAVDWGLDPIRLLQGVSFAETLVDRIVTSEDATDPFACFTEPYMAWYIGGAPDWARRGLSLDPRFVHWVDDVTPARDRKVRLLNGTHTLMAAVGLQMGGKGVREALQHPVLGAFLRSALHEEGVGSFPPPARPAAAAFAAETLERFQNPGIRDTLERLALQMSAKVRARWTPILEGYRREQGRWPERFALGVAAYLRLAAGEFVDLSAIDDPEWVGRLRSLRHGASTAEFVRAAAAAPSWPVPVDEALLGLVVRHLDGLDCSGVSAHIQAVVRGGA